MTSTSLRPQIVQVMAAHRERPLTTEEIHEHVTASAGVAGFDPRVQRDVTSSTGNGATWTAAAPGPTASPPPNS